LPVVAPDFLECIFRASIAQQPFCSPAFLLAPCFSEVNIKADPRNQQSQQIRFLRATSLKRDANESKLYRRQEIFLWSVLNLEC
jgi:hypothetical protein